MPFDNITTNLISDKTDTLYNFIVTKEGLTTVIFNKRKNVSHKKIIISEPILQYDTVIDKNSNIHIVYQCNNKKIKLKSRINKIWNESHYLIPCKQEVFNLSTVYIDEKLHIFYCIKEKEVSDSYKIYHKIYNFKNLITNEIENIKKKGILNHFSLIKSTNQIMLGFYDIVKDKEQLFIKTYDFVNSKWKDKIQVTTDPTNKLYLDMLLINKDLHLVYSKIQKGNLIIKYEKYYYKNSEIKKVNEKELSNLCNCSYPTLIYFEKKLWCVWTEYSYIASCYSQDLGEEWSNMYLWNESKNTMITRYKFMDNEKYEDKNYKFNYSFGFQAPNISFIGFGMLENVSKLPIKKNDINNITKEEFLSIEKTIKKLENEIKRIEKKAEKNVVKTDYLKIINEKVNDLEEKIQKIDEKYNNTNSLTKNIKSIETRIEKIENYLKRRSRPLFGRK